MRCVGNSWRLKVLGWNLSAIVSSTPRSRRDLSFHLRCEERWKESSRSRSWSRECRGFMLFARLQRDRHLWLFGFLNSELLSIPNKAKSNNTAERNAALTSTACATRACEHERTSTSAISPLHQALTSADSPSPSQHKQNTVNSSAVGGGQAGGVVVFAHTTSVQQT
mgnify:CR=1 FL=1